MTESDDNSFEPQNSNLESFRSRWRKKQWRLQGQEVLNPFPSLPHMFPVVFSLGRFRRLRNGRTVRNRTHGLTRVMGLINIEKGLGGSLCPELTGLTRLGKD
ncbi:hypothetical protein V6N12_040144 [Hibiscus sabdariffa]|uniref:Uncharacterized protein n=1 Tax=Hibiscus sabdariffa TaxID=183260 RepID=A0ABR2E2U0_9ROSI